MERQAFPHLTDAQFGALIKMSYILGNEGMAALVQSDAQHQVERIGQYMSYETALIDQLRGALTAQFEHQANEAIVTAQDEVRESLTAQFEQQANTAIALAQQEVRESLEQQANQAIAQAREEAKCRKPYTQKPVMLTVPWFEGKEGETSSSGVKRSNLRSTRRSSSMSA